MKYLGPHSPIPYYPSTGVLTNLGTYVTKVENTDVDDVREWTLRPSSVNEPFIIGTDWKYQDQNHNTLLTEDLSYGVYEDSLANFGHLFYFSEYFGLADGRISITYKQGAYLNISDINSNEALVYPNPVTSGELKVEVGDKEKIKEVVVMGLNGSAVRSNTTYQGAKASIDMNGLQSGVYFIHVVTDYSNYTKKVLVK